MPNNPQFDVLDLRHFSAADLKPLLQDEAARWQQRLKWDYGHATSILLEYVDGRILPGFVVIDRTNGNRPVGYAFCVFEGAKGVVGDVYAFHETESLNNPLCETLLMHLLEMLQATPGVDRIESQLLMYPAGALHATFSRHGFRSYPRLYMSRDLTQPPTGGRPSVLQSDGALWQLLREHNLTLNAWQPAFYDAAAGLIHRCYEGHMDSEINDQYQSYHGAQRFLHNIIRFPGCGIFDAENSIALRDAHTGQLQAVLLCSRIRYDVGHITQLCVAPSLRSKGVGHMMLRHCATQSARRGLTSLSLTVTEANHRARELYTDHGFAPVHRFEAMVWDK